MKPAVRSLALVLLLIWAGCGGPPLRVVKQDSCVFIDVQRLGEYYSKIRSVEIVDSKSGEAIWRAEALDRMEPRVWSIRLCAGLNPLVPKMFGEEEKFKYVTATGKEEFVLRPGGVYRVEVRGTGLGFPSECEFTIPGDKEHPAEDGGSSPPRPKG